MRIATPQGTRPWVVGGAATATALIATLVTWAVWPEQHHASPQRERQYKATTACLLTDDHGLAGDLAKAAWAGMQQASLATRIKVQYLAITGPQNAGNGLSYYNTLGVRDCTVIIAAGPVPVAAMIAGYRQFRTIEHVAIGTAEPPVDPGPSATTPSATTPSGAAAGQGVTSPGPTADPAGNPTIVRVPADSSTTVQRRVQEIVAKAADR